MLDDAVLGNLWGCAFEDLLASDLPNGRNLADDYLKRRGWKEPVGTREYIAALRHAVLSLYEVSDIIPGESMVLRDLLRDGEPVRVSEKSGTMRLRPWDRIATRVVTVRGRSLITGTLLAFDHATSDALVKQFKPDKRRKAPAPELSQSAALFTNAWLASTLQTMLGPRPPLANSDGEPLDFVTLHFPLMTGVGIAEIRQALATIPALRQETANFWNWLAAGTPKLRARKASTQTLTTTMDDGAIVLGNVELKGRRLSLMVNSEARAARGRVLLEAVLAGLVRSPLTEHADLDQMLAERHGAPAPSSGLTPEDERAVLQQFLDQHYRSMLDETIPMLRNRSPRALARTAKGREQVAAWLKTLENHSASLGRDDPMASYDFGWIWRELGVAELRR